MHGVLGDFIGRLRAALASKPITPGTQFYWRAAHGTFATVSEPASREAGVDAVPASRVGIVLADVLPATSQDATSLRSPSVAAPTDDLRVNSSASIDTTGPTSLHEGHADSVPATPRGFAPGGSAHDASAWDDEAALLRAIAAEHFSPLDTCVVPSSAIPSNDEDDPTDVRPSFRASTSDSSTPAARRPAPFASFDPPHDGARGSKLRLKSRFTCRQESPASHC